MDKNVAMWPTTKITGLHALTVHVKPDVEGEMPTAFTKALDEATYLPIVKVRELYDFAGIDFSPSNGGAMLPLFDNVKDDDDLFFHIANKERDQWQVLCFCLRNGTNPELREQLLGCALPHELMRALRTQPVMFLQVEDVPGLAA